VVYAQVQGILTGMQAQLCLIGLHARHGLNLDLSIYMNFVVMTLCHD